MLELFRTCDGGVVLVVVVMVRAAKRSWVCPMPLTEDGGTNTK
jgi:hypothetical protein